MITLEQIEAELGKGIVQCWRCEAYRNMSGTHWESAPAAAVHAYEYEHIIMRYDGWIDREGEMKVLEQGLRDRCKP